MNLIKIIKKFLFIQNITASIIAKIPPYLEFTVGKYLAIKKALYITAHDKTLGSYIEFGIFTGSSFNFAMKANKSLDGLFEKSDCDFIGFDSFEGFGKIQESDNHPRFKDDTFAVDEKKILSNIKRNSKNQKFQIIKGFYKDTLLKKPKDYGIKKARVIMMDCDLKEPTIFALNFVKDVLQKGTIILFDDYIFYKGDEKKENMQPLKNLSQETPILNLDQHLNMDMVAKLL